MRKLILIIGTAFLIQVSYGQSDKDTSNLLELGSDLPEFIGVTLDGDSVSSDDLYGKVVLINFYATWCVPCNLQLPYLEKDVWAKYKDNEDFILLVFDKEEQADVVRSFITKKNWTMPFCLDEKSHIFSLFATKFIPRNYLFDKESRLVLQSNGYNKQEFTVLRNELENLLK